jgi:NAD(P)-dependent dehydrogenase (short-subunit alcohol dehydrogenase family)
LTALDFNGRHALVTGAGSGIGAAIALALAQAGCRLTLAGRSLDKLQTQAEQLRAQVPDLAVVLTPMDVADQHAVQAAVLQAQTRLGPVNILVNNAGQAQSQPFGKTDAVLWQQMLDVNLSGTFHVTQAVLPAMLEACETGTPGRIINIASTAGLMGYAYVSAYVAAKHGVVGLTKALALELARKNITVNALCPGYTETEIVQSAVRNIVAKTGQSEAQARSALAASNPQQRLVQATEVAQSVLWLCAAGSNAINGQAIAIDGGEHAR